MKKFITIAILAAVSLGCDNFTEVDLPSSQLTADAVFEDKATATAAMVDIYAKLRDDGLLTGGAIGISANLGLYTDELDFYGNSANTSANFYNNTLLPSAPEVEGYWNNGYNQIYAANAVYSGVQRSGKLTAEVKNQLMGEALFVRALVHFYLFNTFGDIPYITTTDYEDNRNAHRMPKSEVYSHIKSDLEQAITLLPETYVAPDRVRPNSYTAQALLARVYLYNEEWEEASNAASAVLNQTATYIWEPDLEKVFLKESTATIWQLMPAQSGGNTLEAQTFTFEFGPPPVSALSESLVAAFTGADGRKAAWTKAVTDGTATWYHASKYRENDNTASSREYAIVFRLAEQYLIRAEARAHWGDLIGAREDLDKIRNTAGLPNTTAATQSEIINAILQERRLEFFTEHGHRFFDLKRTGNLDAVLAPAKSGWDTTDRLLPMPEAELSRNANLAPQNPGY